MTQELKCTELTDTQRLEAADLLQKMEAIDAQLATVQTERANAEAGWRGKENFLKTERMKVQVALRGLRQVTVTG